VICSDIRFAVGDAVVELRAIVTVPVPPLTTVRLPVTGSIEYTALPISRNFLEGSTTNGPASPANGDPGTGVHAPMDASMMYPYTPK